MRRRDLLGGAIVSQVAANGLSVSGDRRKQVVLAAARSSHFSSCFR